MDHNFARGARIKPKPPEPISKDIDFPQFMLSVAHCIVKDYGLRDKARFLAYCAIAFEFALQETPVSASEKQT